MKKIILAVTLILLPVIVSAQNLNLDKLPEKERTDYLLKTAYETVMKFAPKWYGNYKAPEITSFLITEGVDKGRLVYLVKYFHDPQKIEEMKYFKYSVAVGIWANTGKIRGLAFGDGLGIPFPTESKTRSSEDILYRDNPYLKK